MIDDLQLRSTKRIGDLVQRYSGGLSLDAGCETEVYFDHFNGNVVGFDITEIMLRTGYQRLKRNKRVFLPHSRECNASSFSG
jgi:SAM-dependent methyltransferase